MAAVEPEQVETSTPAAPRGPFPAATGIATVVEAWDVAPGIRRFALVGAGLAGLPVAEPGEIITLLWAAPGRELVLPESGWRFPAGCEDQHARNYTIRRFDPAAGRIEVDFVLHGDHGRASAWAAAARPGDAVGWAGPREHWRSRRFDWAVLAADETGLPAAAAIAESLDPSIDLTLLVEAPGAALVAYPLAPQAGAALRVLDRGERRAGETTLLADAFAALERPAGEGIVWGGGEAAAMTAIRRHARGEWGLSAEQTTVLGYWKHRRTASWE